MPDTADRAAAELVKYVAEVCKPWVEFYGHEEKFAIIIRKHFAEPKK